MTLDMPPPSAMAAVMQPYFFPYAGYFRLLAVSDIFVIFDCVQFPRRGRVHRCEVPGPGGAVEWLTLPLKPQPREVLIRDLEFTADARANFDTRLARFPWIAGANGGAAPEIREYLHAPPNAVIDHLEAGLRLVARLLDLNPRIVRSSSLNIAPELRGQDRVIAIVRAAGASRYLNAPGGRELYDRADFARANLELNFLAPYRGPYRTMLFDLMTGDPRAMARDIRESADFAPA